MTEEEIKEIKKDFRKIMIVVTILIIGVIITIIIIKFV